MDNSTFTDQFRLRVSDYNCFDHLTPHAILDMFQDVAGRHADFLGVGFDDMIKRNLIWVLVRTKFEILSNPKLYQTVNVTTWPKAKGRLDFDREYLITDENGNVLVKGISKWVVVNYQTRRISLTRDVNYNCEIYPKENFPGAFPKLDDFECDNLPFYEGKTTFSDLDHNGHVNNANYARFILNSINLTREDVIKSFEIDHLKELSPNSDIKVYYKRDGKIIYTKGINDLGEVSFISKIELA